MARIKHGNFTQGHPLQAAGYGREAMGARSAQAKRIPTTTKNGGADRAGSLQKSLDHPGGGPVGSGTRMRIKSAAAGARPHLFRMGNPFVSPDGPHQASQQSRLMNGVGNPPLLPNINDNGTGPGALLTAEKQAAPDGAANFGQRSGSPNGISPELAAQIVKNYILPMFESDAKKDLRTKYNKLT